MRYIMIVLCVAFLSSPCMAEKNLSEHDGNDWFVMSDASKTYYISGFLCGANYVAGKNIENWDKRTVDIAQPVFTKYLSDFDKRKKGASLPKLAQSEVDKIYYFAQYLDDIVIMKYVIYKITVGQIKQGLNVLYSDFRNRNILISDAVYVVNKQITGSSEEEINAILCYLRNPNRNEKDLVYMDKLGNKATAIFP